MKSTVTSFCWWFTEFKFPPQNCSPKQAEHIIFYQSDQIPKCDFITDLTRALALFSILVFCEKIRYSNQVQALWRLTQMPQLLNDWLTSFYSDKRRFVSGILSVEPKTFYEFIKWNKEIFPLFIRFLYLKIIDAISSKTPKSRTEIGYSDHSRHTWSIYGSFRGLVLNFLSKSSIFYSKWATNSLISLKNAYFHKIFDQIREIWTFPYL